MEGNLDWAEAPIFGVEKKEQQQEGAGDHTVQGSQAWLQWRNKGLGSSDAAVLLGLSPWKTIQQLHQEKRGLWRPTFGWAQKNAMERGKKLEPCVRLLYEAWAGAGFPDDTEEHAEHKFMRVSYDGINRKLGRLIEIKCPNQKDHELALMGELPEKYMPQVQWQLMIAGIKEADYVSYNGPDYWVEQAARKATVEERKAEMIRLGAARHMARVRVRRDEEMIKELLFRAIRFWGSIESGVELLGWDKYCRPLEKPITIADDQIEEQSVEQIVAQALAAKAEMDAAEAKYEALKDRLKATLGERDELTVGEGYMRWVKRKGSVDYSLIPELKNVDLDNYRKPDTRAFEFKRRKME